METTFRICIYCSRSAGDEREVLVDFVLSHIGQTFTSKIGEGQRKAGVPKGSVLIRKGLKALDASASAARTAFLID
ncbi:hypothetical protein [Melghirimyces thermohalophilus]|uniref:hypothetical protein n=1 Tax=Melghirimyces thermohalophilus TaxID=1236220 RepID=UPI000B8156F9|nr:hypothetical protein [Melghirimyces thermohalophilus]